MREHSLICRDPEEFPRLWNGKLISGERWWREERTRRISKYSNLSLSFSLSLSSLAPQISVAKWTYNWKSGGPEILLTFFLSRLDISSAELQGWYEHMGRRWGKEKVIRRSLLLVFVRDFLILSFFSLFSSFSVVLSLFHSHKHTFSRPSFPLFQQCFSL